MLGVFGEGGGAEYTCHKNRENNLLSKKSIGTIQAYYDLKVADIMFTNLHHNTELLYDGNNFK